MKHRLKGLLALVLSLVMVFALATNAWAAVSIGNVELNQENNYSVNGISGQGTATYDSTTKTLTLNNFVYEGTYGITATDNLTIDLIGDNKITYSSDSGNASISIEGNLTITSSDPSAKLTADFDTTSSSTKGGGIKATNLTIESGTVSAIAVGTNSHGIEATNAVSITGGTVTAGSATDDGSGNVNYNSAFGIKAGSSISITGGTVTATGLDAIAIYEHTTTGTISISGATTTVTANGGNSGIYAEGSVTISSGKVTATAAEDDSCGIYGGNTITIGGDESKKLEVNVGCKTGLAANTVNIAKGSTVTIDSTEDAISNSATLNLGTGSRWYKWTDDKNATTMNDSDFALSAYNGNSPAYLKFEPLTYTVKFNANGGSGTMADVTGVSGNYTLPANGFNAPVGDEFFGWSVDPAGAERKLPGDTMQITRDTTVYAIWKYATLGNQGGGYPGTPQPPSIYIPTVEDEPEVTTPNTFDGGIASAVVVTILSATGGAWLAKKKD